MHLEKLGISKEDLEKDRKHLKAPYSPNKKKIPKQLTNRRHSPTPEQHGKIDLQTTAKHTKKFKFSVGWEKLFYIISRSNFILQQ